MREAGGELNLKVTKDLGRSLSGWSASALYLAGQMFFQLGKDRILGELLVGAGAIFVKESVGTCRMEKGLHFGLTVRSGMAFRLWRSHLN
ncbi:conserved hypothetical protein [Ricinus communis]|uniref:Uncharacterized protein n=1 Tax=Ricinus communis TaxID=3988 RepID=B9SFS1_RICCO|nr:conserved hypothetical protein [Ricinus communis]